MLCSRSRTSGVTTHLPMSVDAHASKDGAASRTGKVSSCHPGIEAWWMR
jgi:hypothetical protein